MLGLQNSSYTIEPWTPVDSVSWLKAMAWDLRGNMQDEIYRSVISDAVGRARTAQLYPPYPYLRHRPIVNSGAVVDGVWDPTASRGSSSSAATKLPVLPDGTAAVLDQANSALSSLDGLLGPVGTGHRVELLGGRGST